MPNQLAHETSPYLLQHQNNPVEWRPWGEEALATARELDRPIFLSIGYAACHWCHVMEHESFENAAIAELLNARFVCIKVDREERPDLDQLYMHAVQMMTGRGGWPMSVFLTPTLEPFYGGTYWPPTARGGMPGFDQVILAVDEAWRLRREQCIATSKQLADAIREQASAPAANGAGRLGLDLLEGAGRQLERAFDPTHGGFGPAPKFPHAMDLGVLLRLWKRDGRQAWLDMVNLTLERMAAGGIYDHLGGGFARYSVDDRWIVPHFEKMLYDNALLASSYLEAYQATGRTEHRRVACETLDYVLRDMTDPAGGFYSSEDADSPPTPGGHAEEGLFYTWTPVEVLRVLGERAERFCRVYDVTPQGNFEGRSILRLPKPLAVQATLLGVVIEDLERELSEGRSRLLEVRGARPRPGLDDKVLVGWNGLMIDTLARAGAALGITRYVDAAANCAEFLWSEARVEGGLAHTWRRGRAKLAAFLDGYACLANGLLSLYGATFNEAYIDQAAELLDAVLDRFADPESGGFYFVASGANTPITRPKELTDNATPSGNSMAALALLRLGRLTGEARYLAAAERALIAAEPILRRAPMAGGQVLQALDLYLGPTAELVFVGDPNSVSAARGGFLPRTLVAHRREPSSGGSLRLEGLFRGKQPADAPALYVCRDRACDPPRIGQQEIAAYFSELAGPGS